MMKNLPQGWRVEQLGDISKIQPGGTPSRQNESYWKNGDIPWVKISNIKSKYVVETDEFITEDGLKGSSAKLLNENTILYTIFATLGEVAILKIPATTNQAICGINLLYDDKLDYVYYYLKSIKKKVMESGRGVAQNNINLSMLKALEIPLPPLPQQEKIVSVLDTASALVEKQKALLKKYDLFLKSKFIEMFGDPVKNPMGWEEVNIGQIAQVQTGKTPSRKNMDYWDNGTENWAKTTEANHSVIYETEEKITHKAVKENHLIVFPVNTILIAMYGQGKTRGKVVRLGTPSTTNQAFGAILPSEKYNVFFLLALLDLLYQDIRDLGRGGNQENLNLDIVRKIEIILPPIDIQTQFAQIVEQTESLKQKEQQKLEKLQTLYDALMKRTFNGEII